MYKPSKKDLILINQRVGESGTFSNESSLDFALSLLRQRKPWLQELSYIVRSLLTDHVFQDGNKRTALATILTYFSDYEVECDEQKMTETVYKIAKKRIKDINKIVRLMENEILRR